MSRVETVEEKIEQMRNRMYELYAENPTSQKVLEASQALDQALNELEKLRSPYSTYI